MKYLHLIAHVALSTLWDSVLLVSGPKTPDLLNSLFSECLSVNISAISQYLRNSSDLQPSLVLDISLDPTSFAVLDPISMTYEIPYLTITKELTSDEYSKWRFHVFPPIKDEAFSLSKLIKYLSWDSFSVFLSNSVQNLEFLEAFKENLPGINIKSFIYDANPAEKNLKLLIKRLIKTTGERHLLILDNGSSLERFVNCLKLSKINQFGNFFLFGANSFYSVDLEGSLILMHEDEEKFESIEKFYFEEIKKILDNIKFFSIENLKKSCKNFVCSKKFFLVNQQNNKKVKVGEVKEKIEIFNQIIFSGNNTSLDPIMNKTKIPVMIINGTSEPDGIIQNPLFSKFYYGAAFAMDQVNKKMEKFEYQMIPTDCGNVSFNITWAVACFSNYLNKLGVAYITSYLIPSAFANLISLRMLQQFIPQISPYAISEYLNNKTQYPEFLKFTGNFGEFLKNSAYLLRFYNWMDMLILSNDNDIGRSVLKYINKIVIDMGLRFITPEEFRYIPENYTRNDFEKFKDFFEFIKNSKCRMLSLQVSNPSAILEGLYDVGLRRGDIIIMTSVENYFLVTLDGEEIYLKKRLEIFDGALLNTLIEYDGELGKEVEKEMLKKFDSIENLCVTYDNFLVVHYAIQYLMSKGENYDDAYLLMEAMRNQRFIGCSGDVFFIPNENSRSNSWCSTLQVTIDYSTNKMKATQITAFNLLAVKAARKINEPKWPTDEKSIPTNYRESGKCVYSKYKQISKAGLLSIHIISSFYLVILVVVAYLSRRFYEHPLSELPDKAIESYQDFFFRFFFLCEFFQILALEHEGGLIEKSLNRLNYLAGLDLITMVDLKFSNYWKFHHILIGFSLGYLVLVCAFLLFKNWISHRLKFLEIFPEFILPVIGHFLFMPISLMLMSIFKCEESTSDALTHSFFFRDCSQYCYQGKHKTFVILSSITLAFFLSISTFFRPYWEITQTSLKIKTKVSYLSIMSVFQFSLIVLKLNSESYSKAASGFLICVAILLMIFVTWRMKPYNYEKMTAYQVVVLVMGFWGILISSISNLVSNDYELKILLFIGMILILLSGLKFASTFVSKFEEDDENSVVNFLKFQFSNKLPEIISRSRTLISFQIETDDNNRFNIPS